MCDGYNFFVVVKIPSLVYDSMPMKNIVKIAAQFQIFPFKIESYRGLGSLAEPLKKSA